jgi:homeobox protein HoxA/B2
MIKLFNLSSSFNLDSNSKKSCQGCELPSDDVPDSTSNSRGQNNNTPSATNNNQSNPNERTNGSMSRGTPNSTIELGVSGIANAVLTTSISNADSSVASTNSLEEEEESPVKIKKKEEGHSKKVSINTTLSLTFIFFNKYI